MKKNIIIFIAIFLVAQTYATKRYVRIGGPQSDDNFLTWETAASNIQAAVDISVFGDEIIVSNGTYFPGDSDGILVTGGIKLKSVNGAAVTIIDGEGTKRCIRITHAGDVVEGFTIQNGGNSGGNGGGFLCENGLVKNCLITDNNANSANGGGIYFNNNGRAENCIIKNNNASSAQGGGVYFNNGGELRNCLITANSAKNGGGISFDTIGTVQNCTIVKNTAGTQGGGAYALSGGTMINSIIYLNTANSYSNVYNLAGLASLSYCCVAPLSIGEGNIDSEPGFLNEPSGRYQLNCGSSCINVGNNSPWMLGTFDLDSNLRIFDGIVDIGAYEYLSPFINIDISNIGSIAENLIVTPTSNYGLVSYDFNDITIMGTNNFCVVGEMHLMNPAQTFATAFSATQTWSSSNVPLNVGDNIIEVNGTNRYGIFTNDFATIERGGIGTGLPFINITNENKLLFSYDVIEASIGGTNNIHVMGSQLWTNELSGQHGFLPVPMSLSWEITNISLDVGENKLSVSGTNYWNRFTNDFVIIERGGVGTGAPFLDITSNVSHVDMSVSQITIAGTNNIHVVGVTWENTTTIESGIALLEGLKTPASRWTVPNINLEEGDNEITVTGTNAWGVSISDTIIITRGGEPLVDIVSTNIFVTYDSKTFTARGTNNKYVVSKWWINLNSSENGNVDSSDDWNVNIPIVVGTNEIIVYGSNLWEVIDNDSVIITRGDIGTGAPFIDITNENALLSHNTTKITIAGTNNLHVMGNMWWTNSFTGDNAVFPAENSWNIPDINIETGTNLIYVFGTNVFGIQTNDVLTIVRELNTNGLGVLCTWPELIGKKQTGTVEFISLTETDWTLFSGSTEIASGICTAGWNLVEFFAGDLPIQDEESSNQLVLAISGLDFNAGAVIVIEDNLKTNPEEFVKDLDDDLIYVKYIPKAGGVLRTEGRTLFIEDGNAKDKLIIKVKPAIGKGDGVCRISGIICNGDLGMIKIPGDLDKLIVNGSLKKLMLKGGSLGHNCKTKLHNVRFRSAAGKSLIKTVAGKNKLDKKVIPANVFANILCGEINDDGTIEPEILKMLSIVGGNLGLENNRKKLDAKAVANVILKPKNNLNGDIIDYSFYLTGEEKVGGGMSVKKIMANNIIDSNSSNSYFICGYDTDIKTNSFPYDVSGTNWLNHEVEYNFGKIIVKGSDLNGTFVIKDWSINKGKIKQVKAKGAGTDDALWIVDQEIDD